MSLKTEFNPITGDFDLVLEPYVTQTATTTDATLTPVSGSKTITANTTTAFKTVIVGRRTNAPLGNIYHYEVIGSVKNVSGVLTLGNITGTTYTEDDALGIDVTTGNAISVSVSGSNLDFGITGASATSITWKLETTFTEI